MGAALYGRRCRVTISLPVATPGDFTHTTTDELVIDGGDAPGNPPGMRVQFKIDKTDQKAPNTSQVVISNLSPTTRSALQKKGVKLQLEAGYQATGMSRIFIGDVRTVDHVRNGADWETRLKLGDGERAYRFARANESFGSGTPTSAILMRLANLSGLTLGNVQTVAASLKKTIDHGYKAYGRWSDVFGTFVNSLGLTWSIQDGALQVLAPGDSVATQVPLISASTGLLDSPEMGTPEKKGAPALLKFKALLFPANPGTQVQIKSLRYDGVVVLRKVSLVGDTHGDDWFTQGEGVLLHA